jgi:hypothetical protein
MEARETRVTLRLPIPPTWDGPVEGVAAAARRARRAYVSILDAMHRGRDEPGRAAAQAGKLERFVADLRRDSARAPLLHLVRIWRTVERAPGAAPLLRSPPPTPATAALVHVPAPTGWLGQESTALEAWLEARYAWPLEWLRTRGYLAPRRDLRLEWRLLGPA